MTHDDHYPATMKVLGKGKHDSAANSSRTSTQVAGKSAGFGEESGMLLLLESFTSSALTGGTHPKVQKVCLVPFSDADHRLSTENI